MKNTVKIHHTHKQRIRSLFRQGFSIDELVQMYKNKLSHTAIKEITKGQEKPERI